jgi:hypothetical protein
MFCVPVNFRVINMLRRKHDVNLKLGPNVLSTKTLSPFGSFYSSFIRLYNNIKTMPNLRSCLVSFPDTEGIEHSVRIAAESLYEAAVEAMAAFRGGAFAEMPVFAWLMSRRQPKSTAGSVELFCQTRWVVSSHAPWLD